MRAKYGDLLGDEDVKRWYKNLAANSVLTATAYLRWLGLYRAVNGTSPREILQIVHQKEFRDRFADFVRRLEREGKAGSYIARFKKVLLSWLVFNNISVKLKVNIARESDAPTIADERVPTKEELAKILRKATSRGRVAIAIMPLSGLRPESLGDYLGTDGLRLGDFREAKIKPDAMEFEKVPSMLVIRANLSKARHQYFTFVPQEALAYIGEYLEERAKAGEAFNDQTPIFRFDPRGVRKNSFLRTTLVTRDVKEAIGPESLLRRQHDSGRVVGSNLSPYLQFLMGHKGDIEARYSTNKGRLPPSMIEEMRDSYKRSQKCLQTTAPVTEEDDIPSKIRKQMLLTVGYRQDEIEKLNLPEMGDDTVQDLMRQKLFAVMMNNGQRQKIVASEEVEKLVATDWEWMGNLSDGRAVLRLPG